MNGYFHEIIFSFNSTADNRQNRKTKTEKYIENTAQKKKSLQRWKLQLKEIFELQEQEQTFVTSNYRTMKKPFSAYTTALPGKDINIYIF